MASILLHAFVVAAGNALIVIAGIAFTRRSAKRLNGKAVNDVISTYVAVIGTLYAVLLAFVLLSVWEQYDTAQGAAEREASQLSDLVRLTAGLPPPSASRLKDALREYTAAVIDEEWAQM